MPLPFLSNLSNPTDFLLLSYFFFFSPPFSLNFKWLLPYPQYWLGKFIWKEKELIVQFFVFLLVDAACCLLFVWAFFMPIAQGGKSDIFSFFIWNPFFYFFTFEENLSDLNQHVIQLQVNNQAIH